MKIIKMTATFGGLEQAVLEPGEGFTVITAPNEGGKSTWAAFLRTMLYGLDTRERDKAGSLADKNRYQPWSGAPMGGEVELEWQGRRITLRRTGNRTGPMQQFEAFYTATGDPVPGLTGANAGQTLLGVGKDVFTRTALVGQNASAVTAAPELERRVAALATSGEETVSAGETQRTLKDWRNRRRSNRANGLIPELEGQLRQVEGELAELNLAQSRKAEAEARLKELSALCTRLEEERELHRKLAQKEQNRRCGEAQQKLEEAEARLRELPAPDPVFAGMTAREATELEQARRAEAEEIRRLREENKETEILSRRKKRVSTLFKITAPLLGFGGLAMVIGGFVSKLYGISYWGFGCMALTVALSVLFVYMLGNTDKKLHELREQAAEAEEPVIPDAAGYLRWLDRRELLEGEVRHCRERLEDLTAQGAQPLNTLELLPQPAHSAGETERLLAAARGDTALWQSRLDRAIGALRTDPLTLETARGKLEEELARRTEEYDALDLALEVLDSANAQLRERFSPQLNREAAELFSRLTDGRYDAVALSRDFSATVGNGERHSALSLSAGTVDQLYLAVRLALCRLTVPDAPILLDDALCAFDDVRARLALELLRDMGAGRQILLFSCHSREGAWAEQNGVTHLSI